MKTQKKCTAILARFLVLAILCASFPGRILAANSSWSPTLLVNTEAFSVIDDRDTTANIVLKFGGTLGKTLTYDRTRGIFQLNAGLSVVGAISGSSLTVDGNASVSGALLVKGNVAGKSTFSGANLTFMGAASSYILGKLGVGTTAPETQLEVAGTISGSVVQAKSVTGTPTLTFSDATTTGLSYNKDFSILNVYVNGSSLLRLSSGILQGNANRGPLLNISNTLDKDNPAYTFAGDTNTGLYSATADTLSVTTGGAEVGRFHTSGLSILGTLSGTTLNANTLLTGSTLQGFGLYDCNGTSNKLTYNATTKKFLCEADQTGGAGAPEVGTSSFSGATLRLGDERYVNQSGDTMTGALTINLSSGFLGLKVVQTASGKIFHAEQSLTSSGTLRVEGVASFDDALTFGDALSDLITVNAASWTFANDTNFALSGGVNGLSFDTTTFSVDALNDRIGIGTTTPETTLEVVGTISGSTIHASSQLRSSGSILAEQGGFFGSGIVVTRPQRSEFIRLQDSTNSRTVGIRTGDGSPNGSVTASLGSLYIDNASGRLYRNSNGSSQWTEIVTGSGSAHMAKMYDSLSSGVGDTLQQITFDAEEFDVGDIADVSTDRFTIRKAGKYLVTASMPGANINESSNATVIIYKNGSEWKRVINYTTDYGDLGSVEVSDVMSLSAGDYLELYGYCSVSGCNGYPSPASRMSVVQLDAVTGSGSKWTDAGTTTYLSDTTDRVSIGATSAKAKLDVLGIMSGTTLYASRSFSGAGLMDCDNGTTSKLLWDATTARFSCGTDQTGGGASNWSNTGSLQTAFDSRYVNQSGDTMTGALTINLSSGFLGLKVVQTASGKIFHAEQSLTSSGTLRVEGVASFDDALTFGDALSDLITVNAASWTFANDTNFALSGGVNGLSFDTTTFSVDATNDRIGIGTTTPETTLEVVGTVSGSSVWGYNLNNSQSATSGSILVSRQNRQPEWKTPVSSLVWFLDGGAVQTASQGATVTMPFGMTLTSVTLRAKTAPTGSALIVDINENGTTLFSTRPQINAGATTGGSSAVFSDTSLAAGSDITVDIDQVGSTLTGSGITIMLNGTRRY